MDPEDRARRVKGAWELCPLWGFWGQLPLLRWEVWHPSLQGCFSGMPLIPVPIYGVKMSFKLSKWLLDIVGRLHGRN